MVFRDVTDDGTVRVTGKPVPVGGSQPTIASVVSYSGSTNLQATNVEAALDELDAEKAPISHTHSIGNVTGLQAALDAKAALTHNHDGSYAVLGHQHDDRYFTEVEVTSLLAGKSDTSHTHDSRYYTETEMDTLLAGKSASGHTHIISNVTGLQTALDAKAGVSHTHDDRYFTEVEVTSLLAGKSDTGHLHDDRYYTEAEVDAKISSALATTELHDNPHFDFVEMSTDGAGSHIPAARLYPSSWQNYWSTGDGTVLLEADNTKQVSGSGYSLRAQFTAVTKQAIVDSTVFACSPGAVVTASAWVLGQGTTGPYAEIGVYTAQDADPSVFDPGTISASIIPGTVWRKLTVSKVIPAGHNRARLTLRAFSSGIGTTGTIWWDATTTAMQIIPPSDVVTGEIKMWPTATAPTGYLLCNGGTFSSTTYPALAALLGDTFGTHSGTTYYLPDFRGRSPMGLGAAVPAMGGTALTMGQKYGDDRLHAHSHSGTTGASHAGSGYASVPEAYYTNTYGLIQVGSYAGRPMVWTNADEIAHTHTFSTSNAGSGSAQNMHPVLGVNFIIKAA